MLCYINYKRVEKPLRIPNLEVEIGFGRGDFIVKLAKENPDKNFLGMELSAISVEKLLRRVERERLKNVYCVHIDAYWGFYLLFEDNYLERIYMNYPDPWFKKRHHRRRLTTPERLYMFTRKLKKDREIRIRSDNREFLDFTKEVAGSFGCFEIRERKLTVKEPLTKYESKWLSMGRELYELVLIKRAEPPFVEHPVIEEVKEVFPERVEKGEVSPERLENREIKLGEAVYLKTFRLWQGKEGFLLECLLAEKGYHQKFFMQIKKKESYYIVDISPFSEVLRTRNLQRAVREVASLIAS
ncbi:MAG: tRNA (guanosine(46)-N7)-methyltransferase TrmB [Aquificae bacterium]|nr:tRNA (guanosine(46)-N7)-methyltransferase TrmB [Aquificota bacterium]